MTPPKTDRQTNKLLATLQQQQYKYSINNRSRTTKRNGSKSTRKQPRFLHVSLFLRLGSERQDYSPVTSQTSTKCTYNLFVSCAIEEKQRSLLIL